MPDRIITHHISPYHAAQGTEAEVRRIVGQPKPTCLTCGLPIGALHHAGCEWDGAVSISETNGSTK